jgi:hypothetical protein
MSKMKMGYAIIGPSSCQNHHRHHCFPPSLVFTLFVSLRKQASILMDPRGKITNDNDKQNQEKDEFNSFAFNGSSQKRKNMLKTGMRRLLR